MGRCAPNKGDVVDPYTSYKEMETVGKRSWLFGGKTCKQRSNNSRPLAVSVVTCNSNSVLSNSVESSHEQRLRNETFAINTDHRGLTSQQQRSRVDLFDKYREPASERARLQSSPPAPLAQQQESRKLGSHYAHVGELETYAILQSHDVTKDIYNCMTIVEETTEVAATTMDMLHEQGRQIPRSHYRNSDVMETLHEGEKVLGSFGGLFARRWKPKKGRRIKGPRVEPDSSKNRTVMGYRASALSGAAADTRNRIQRKANRYAGLSGTKLQLEVEREHQDEALSNLGDIVVKLRDMSFEMGSEVGKQTTALSDLEDDVDVVVDRLRQSNHRTRYLSSR